MQAVAGATACIQNHGGLQFHHVQAAEHFFTHLALQNGGGIILFGGAVKRLPHTRLVDLVNILH